MLGVVISLVGALGISLTVQGGASVLAIALPISMGLGSVFWVIVWLRHRSSGGRGGRVVAEDWVRWRHERPALRALAFKRFPWRWFALALTASIAGIVGLIGFSHPEEHTDFLVLAFAFGYLFFIPVLLWNNRWNEIEFSEHGRRTEAFFTEAVAQIREREKSSQVVTGASKGRSPSVNGVD